MSENYKETYLKINEFIIKNIFIILILTCGVFYFLKKNNDSRPVPYRNKNVQDRNNYADSPMMMSGRSGNYNGGQKTHTKINLKVEDKNPELLKNILEYELESQNAIIEEFNSFESKNTLVYNLTIKALKINVENIVKTIKEKSNFVSQYTAKEINSENYLENQDKLADLKVRKTKLEEMLKKENEKLADKLSVEREINSIQNSITYFEKNNKEINDKNKYAQIELKIFKQKSILNINSNCKMALLLNNSIENLINFSYLLLGYVFNIILFLPYFAVAYLAFKKIKKNKLI